MTYRKFKQVLSTIEREIKDGNVRKIHVRVPNFMIYCDNLTTSFINNMEYDHIAALHHHDEIISMILCDVIEEVSFINYLNEEVKI